MRTSTMALTAGILATTATAEAAFLGLHLETFVDEHWLKNGYEGLVTWRLYADFDMLGEDGVLAAYGVQGLPASWRSSNGVFHNAPPGLDSLTAPQDLRLIGIWEHEWDTFVTINRTDAGDDQTAVSPGFATETNGLATDWRSENAGWFVTPDAPQARAVDGRVVLAQITMAEGETPSGVASLLLLDGTIVEQVPFSAACRGDIDQDGQVGVADVVAVLSAWGPCPRCCTADLECDGNVGVSELLEVLSGWGLCP